MPHVDEGQVHAYLDGQLEYADPAKRRELEHHIAECASCAALLEEARAVSERANALLRDASQAEPTVPPFEAIVERAADRAATTSVNRLGRFRTLAWAASVILAVGLGLYARPYVFERRDVALAPEASDPQAEVAPDDEVAVLAFQATNEAEAAAPLPSRSPAARVAAGRGVASTPEAPAPVTARDAEVDRLEARDELAEDAPAVPAPTPVQEPAEQRRETPDVAKAQPAEEQERADAAARRLEPDSRADRLARARQAPRDRGFVDLDSAPTALAAGLAADSFGVAGARAPTAAGSTIAGSTIEEAHAHLGGPLVAVPGLQVVSVVIDSVAGRPAVQLVQRLDSGDLLELVMWSPAPAEAEPARERFQADEGVSALTVEVGDYRVTGRAVIPADSLRALLRRLRESPTPN
jgi:hypothetical protein